MDKVEVKVNPESSTLFVAKETGFTLEVDDLKLGGVSDIPKQLP